MLMMPGKKKQMPSKAPEMEGEEGMEMELEVEPMEEEALKPLAEYSVEELKAALAAKLKEGEEPAAEGMEA